MKKFIFAIISVSVLMLGAIFIFAQKGSADKGRSHKGFGHRGFNLARMAEKLNLSDEQKTQIKQILETSKSKVQPILTAMRENRQKLKEATVNGAFDEAQVQTLATEQGNLSAQLILEKERAKAQVFQVLTPEQREQAKQMKEQFKDKFKRGFKNRKEKTTQDTTN